MSDARPANQLESVAVIGMAGRFPGAGSIEEFWENLCQGVESITTFSQEEVLAAGVDPALLQHPDYVRAGAILEDIALFDASFFGFNAREAQLIDPQQRLFLECAWHALERAGYTSGSFPGRIGVYGGASLSTYLLFNLVSRPDLMQHLGGYQTFISNDGAHLTTRVSYKLNLRGPSFFVQTACSTSLVAIHLACQSLLNGECDMALAGGVAVNVPQKAGYLYQEGGILSPDGHCRPFAAQAQGTVSGEGVALVVLKRLADALTEGDSIAAVIRASALNNDGALKVGYTAPSVEGQAEVITEALALAGISPETISYVETHGTGTPLGDPIEIAGLTQAFRSGTQRRGSCALGSVKSNIGHLDAAAGVAGLIKTVLMLQHQQLPPSLHCQTPNPQIDFGGSPFYVNTECAPWPAGETPRRAGVSSFGVGGTNAHVVLEEAPEAVPSGPGRSTELLLLSARTEGALERMTEELASYLAMSQEPLADIAYTLAMGRTAFGWRRVVVGGEPGEVVTALRERDPQRVVTGLVEEETRPVVFMFPGGGAQYVQMGRELYESEGTFRQVIDECAELLTPYLPLDLRQALYPDPECEHGQHLTRTSIALPALFAVEYALAQLWMEWGIMPQAMIGHSLGEYVAACLAGVLSLDDALALVALRGHLFEQLPRGLMLSVPMTEDEVHPLLHDGLSLAALNGPRQCVVSGTVDAAETLATALRMKGVEVHRLQIDVAAHSNLVEPILDTFMAFVAQLPLQPPAIPYISNVTGTWITAAEATDPAYWTRHLRQTVRFSAGVQELLQEPRRVLLEVGPGRTLSTLVKHHQSAADGSNAFMSMRHPYDQRSDVEFLLQNLGELWLSGVDVTWSGVYQHQQRRRLPLPTYAFDRQRYWIEPVERSWVSGNRDAEPDEASTTGAIIAPAPALPRQARPRVRTTYVAPRTDVEQTLAGVWQAFLGIEQVGVHDNFLELGGDSLLATQVLSRVRDLFPVDVPLRRMFETPTIAGLADSIEIACTQQHRMTEPMLRRAARDGHLPLSFAQQRLWFLDQLEPDNAQYNVPVAVRLRGQLDVGALEQSLNEIVARHEALRTTFRSHDGQPVQLIAPSLTLPLAQLDLQTIPADQRDQVAQERLTAEAQRTFDLLHGPVIRTTLLCLAPQDHILLLAMHHIVSDGWSLGVFFRELSTLYRAFTQGAPSPLPPLPLQYADFALWQREWLHGEVLQRQLTYWNEQLAAAPAVLELPTDRPRPPLQSFRGARHTLTLPCPLVAALQELSRQEGVTLFMTLLAAFQTLLLRYTGQEDVVVGSPIANRTRSEIEGLIGFFVNTLVLRSDLRGDPSFRELLQRVREVTLQAYAHQDVPFERLVETVQPQRSLSHTPLFQVLFQFHTTPMNELALADLSVDLVEIDPTTSKFDLTLALVEAEGELIADLDYNTDLFDAATIERMAGHFQTLLQGIVAKPDQHLSTLPLLTPAERVHLTEERNATAAPYPQDRCLHELFEAQVRRTPDAVAVRFEDDQLSYKELNRRANGVAHRLRELGVGPEVRVGLCLERGVELMVAVLGILKAGGAYVPLDPTYPQERLAFMLADARATVVVSQQHLINELPLTGMQLLCLDRDGAQVTEPSENPATAVMPDNLAYVIYTSGSTGVPKGVAMPHRPLTNLLEWQARQGSTGQGARTLQFSSMSFDVSCQELFSTWSTGGTLVLLPEEVRRDGVALARYLAAEQIERVFMPFVALQHLAEAWSVEECDLSNLHEIITAGEQLQVTPAIVRLFNRIGESTLVNQYGPSESHVVSAYALTGPPECWESLPPIGVPIGNLHLYVLDAAMQPVPIGITGELYIGGTGLARGYLDRPSVTAERFIPDPFSGEEGTRLYRTGDLARYRADGAVEFLGRRDNQVKVRGFRIELGEIEAVLRQHPAVGEAAVVATPDQFGERRLVGYVACPSGQSPALHDLRTFLQEKLPEYMVPAIILPLGTLPLTPSGKIDRQALPAPESAEGIQRERAVVGPRDTVELRLIQIWEDLLGVRPIGVMDSFFDLGGHSLVAVRLIARIQSVFGQSLPLSSLFQGPTIECMAGLLRQRIGAVPPAPIVAIQPHGSKLPFFCVHPVGGSIFALVDLARHVGIDQPFHGLQAPGLDGEQEPFGDLVDLATHHLRVMQTVQPHGPYRLGGWSFGGVVAFEMARQLDAQGEQLDLVALLDTFAPVGDDDFTIDDAELLHRFAYYIGHSAGQDAEHPPGEPPPRQSMESDAPADGPADDLVEKIRALHVLPPDVGSDQIRWLFHVFRAHTTAFHRYQPLVYPGRLTLFRASEHLYEGVDDEYLGWGDLARGGVDVYPVPGNHYTIVRDPHVQVMAEQLRRHLARDPVMPGVR